MTIKITVPHQPLPEATPNEDEDLYDDDTVDEDLEFEPGEDGDFCPFCGAFSPAFSSGCSHHIASVGHDICITEEASWLIPLRDAYDDLINFIHIHSGGRSFEQFKKIFERRSLLTRRVVECAQQEAGFLELLSHIGYAEGSGWSTGGFMGGAGWSVYQKDLEASTQLEQTVQTICKDFVAGAAGAALSARQQHAHSTPN